MSFRTAPCAPDEPLRVVLVGAGGMGRSWLSTITGSAELELTGVVDLDLAVARAAVIDVGSPEVPIGTDAVEVARSTGAQALINVTVPQAHHPVTAAALFAGLPVLGEKPAAATVAQTLSLVAAAEVTGQLFMVSQSRRWNPQLAALRGMTQQLGVIGTVTTEFFKAAHLPGFREEMDDPLLVDMAIHAFDSVRYLLDADPVSAYCQAYNPPWSWFAGNANAAAVFEMTGGARYVFNGSWCSPGAETSWNGEWRISGERGTARWNGEDDPTLDGNPLARPETPEVGSGIGGALQAFVHALRTGETPSGEVHENLMSLAMVESAVESARTGGRTLLDDVLNRALEQALRDEQRAEVRERLAAWPSVRAALRQSAESAGVPS